MADINKYRDKFPDKNPDGTNIIDMESQKFIKIWQGPQHPGITGNMSLELIMQGDEVLECKTHVGYLHRGFEKLMERRLFIQNFPLCVRIAVPEPDFNEYCYAATLEELAGIKIPDAAEWMRTLILEMSRLTSFLMHLGGQAGAFGLGVVAQWSNYVRDLMLDRFEEISGGRIYRMHMPPGGVRGLTPDGFEARMEETLRTIESTMRDIDKTMFDNAIFKRRTVGLGYIDPAMVDEYGVTGPNARAAGIPKDVRKDYPYLKYPELDFDVITATESDVYTRTVLRREEILLSVDLIRQIMVKMPKSGEYMAKMPNVLHWKIPKGETYIRAECTRGEYGYYTVTDGSGYPRRVNVRGPSYTHAVALMERLAIDCNIADTAGLMLSLHTYPPEIER
ncbi:MAG: NADH-quinone oxidoreductase subunit D [Candidatus Marinimicrobia bacterium]|nr:NADH-quinone oxidoreductase subunit D [Candidatus Neomarinimicrobiota bacterium]